MLVGTDLLGKICKLPLSNVFLPSGVDKKNIHTVYVFFFFFWMLFIFHPKHIFSMPFYGNRYCNLHSNSSDSFSVKNSRCLWINGGLHWMYQSYSVFSRIKHKIPGKITGQQMKMVSPQDVFTKHLIGNIVKLAPVEHWYIFKCWDWLQHTPWQQPHMWLSGQ